MKSFTPYSALAGGLLIGLSASLLLWLNGRIAGVSGIARGLVSHDRNEISVACATSRRTRWWG
jgi:uncharacterized membrane protein YedE/YeeE